MTIYRKQHILPLFLSMLSLCAGAQTVAPVPAEKTRTLFSSLDLGVSLGDNGLGLDLTMPVSDMVKVRAGVNYFPHTNIPMSFNLMSYAGDDADPTMTEDERFEKLSSLMSSFTGIEIDRKVDMHAKGTMVDFKLLVDVYPLKNNKHWHATAGFYWGSSKVGHIENTIQEAPTLMGVMMYNNLYDYFVNNEFIDKPLYNDMYIDPMVGLEMKEKFLKYGRVGAHVGDFTSQSPLIREGGYSTSSTVPYLLQPDENGTVRADMYVNSFKPYIGIGYNTCVSKDGRWNIGFEAGALFWGGPKIRTHERYIYTYEDGQSTGITYGSSLDKYVSAADEDNPVERTAVYGDYINLAKDVSGIGGKVGTYVDLAKTIHVFPVLNFKISYKLF